MNFTDSTIIDGVRRTKDGYLAAYANVARTGVQKYKGHELGKPELDTVMVYRPPEEVFHKDALKSMAHRPVTLTHPKEVVDSKNWKKYAKGHTGEEVIRDGDHVRVPMVLMDAEAIEAVEKHGTKELSMGYSTDLKWEPGVTDAGEKYDAIQTEIRANHLALVPVARGGDKLRFGDGDIFDEKTLMDAVDQIKDAKGIILSRAKTMDLLGKLPKDWKDSAPKCPKCGADISEDDRACGKCGESLTKSKSTKDAINDGKKKGNTDMTTKPTVLIDGVSIEVVDDLTAALINNKVKVLGDTIESLKADIVAKQALVDTANGEITVLKKQVTDAAITPEKLDVLVADRSSVITAASTLLDTRNYDFGGKKLEDIRRAAVAVKLGDAVVKDMSDASIEGAFKALTADAPKGGTRALADSLNKPGQANGKGDVRDEAYAVGVKHLTEAWRGPSATKQ